MVRGRDAWIANSTWTAGVLIRDDAIPDGVQGGGCDVMVRFVWGAANANRRQ
jgi:hypothetical protein